jgi:hypothetical protein
MYPSSGPSTFLLYFTTWQWDYQTEKFFVSLGLIQALERRPLAEQSLRRAFQYTLHLTAAAHLLCDADGGKSPSVLASFP